MKKTTKIIFSLISMLVFGTVGVLLFMAYFEQKSLNTSDLDLRFQSRPDKRHSSVSKIIDSVFQKNDQTIQPLEKKWVEAVEGFRKFDTESEDAAHLEITAQLTALLDSIIDLTSRALGPERIDHPENGWRLFNIRGAARMMKATIAFRTSDPSAESSTLRIEAASDFRQSIAMVDRLPDHTYEKNIPRWNLEIAGQDKPIGDITYLATP